MATKKTSARKSGGSRASARSGSSRSRSGRSRSDAPPLPGARAVPVLTEEQQAQADRDKKGITRPGFIRRDLREGISYGSPSVFYPAGEKREIPQGLADHLDTIGINPDASTEAQRKTRFGGGKEDDQESQGKAITSAREGNAAARVKHRSRPEFEAIAGSKKK